MKLLILFFSFSLFAESSKQVDLGLKKNEATVKMWRSNEAQIYVEDLIVSSVRVTKQMFAECQIVDVVDLRGHHRVDVSFDPILEDGENSCEVEIRRVDGTRAKVKLYILVLD